MYDPPMKDFKRIYKEKNVYEAAIERIDFIFKNFSRVYVSFSGGKDSGILLNLVIQYMRANKIKIKLGVQIMDNEANYEMSLEFMKRIIDKNLDILDVYWCCLPITLPCTVSAFAVDWQAWGERDKERWIRPRPDDDYVVTFDNHIEKFGMDYFEEDMSYDHFWDGFGEWYSQGKPSANLIGIRTDESLNRFRAILNARKETFQDKMWTKKNSDHSYNCYPIFDWKSSDIWYANTLFEWDYNKLYDLFYKAGVPVGSMRVASPFMSEGKSSLSLYRVIDPHVWAKLCARVQGANFVATYGKQLSYRTFTLPEGHTWKSFVKFLLATLPKEISDNFKMRFIQSFRTWGRKGRGLTDEIIEDLIDNGVQFKTNGFTAHGSQTLRRVVVKKVPDHLDMLKCHNSDVTSWKRFAITILKNDHTCKYMGLAPTKDQALRQRQIVEKYKSI